MDNKKRETTANSQFLKLSDKLVIIDKLIIVPFAGWKDSSQSVDYDI